MGLKTIKQAYGIDHIVQLVNGMVHIGSPYINNILVITPAGEITKRDNSGANEKITRHQDEIDADPERFATLFAQADVFGDLVTVYTCEDGVIVEKQCEEVGWPNVTTDGQLQYEGQFSTDRDQVLRWALRNAEASVENMREIVAEAQSKLDERMDRLAHVEDVLARLREAETAAAS